MGNEASTLESMAMNPQFWKNKKVFVTGHTGFKGSWLSLWLQDLGAEVCGYALAPATQPNLFDLAHIAHDMDSIIGDIRDLETLEKTINRLNPEIVLHLAAQPLVRYSYDCPIETYATNVMGTVHILEAARQCASVKVVINVTTDKCYENKEWVWGYRENEPLGGFDPYSNSKACSELVTSAYRDSFYKASSVNKALASARSGNVVGGGDWSADRLIPDIVQSIIDKRDVEIRYPNAIRPWQHVLEPLAGYLLLAERLWDDPAKYSTAWNFGPYLQDTATVKEIVENMIKQWGSSVAVKKAQGEASHEAGYLKLDIAKAVEQLMWHPQLSLHQALELTVAWYKAWHNREDMRAVTLKQIHDYQHLGDTRVKR
jgi:CDP-glucose 4,6-dehydratase